MPSLQEVSFLIKQKFHCRGCCNEWKSAVQIPQAGRNCHEHTTIEAALQKSLHASASVLYGNIGMRDILISDPALMSQKVKENQGVIEFECKANYASNRTCPDCMYVRNECGKNCSRDHDLISTSSNLRITRILDESLNYVTTEDSYDHSTMWYHQSVTNPGPLDETAPVKSSSYSITKLLEDSPHTTQQTSTFIPVPAPRRSLASTGSSSPNMATMVPEELKSSDGTSIGTTTDTNSTQSTTLSIYSPISNHYEPALPFQPPVPPKEDNIFHYTLPADELRDAIRWKRVRDCFAVVELEVKDGNGAVMRSPYVILCPQLAEGYKLVLETPQGKLFIHEAKQFRTLKSLLVFYMKHPTGCGAYLKNQLTKRDYRQYLNNYNK